MTNSMQSLHDLSHLAIIFQKAQSHILATMCEVEPLHCGHKKNNSYKASS